MHCALELPSRKHNPYTRMISSFARSPIVPVSMVFFSNPESKTTNFYTVGHVH